jgi:hypothetical protein
MLALPAIIKYWKPIAIITGSIVLYGCGYLNGMNSEKEAWQEARLKATELNLKINNEVSNELQTKHGISRNRYDAIRLRAAGRVFICATGRCDAGASAKGLSGDLGEEVTRMMLDAQRQTDQLIACQNWIRSQKK